MNNFTNGFFSEEEKWANEKPENLLSVSFDYDTLKLSRNPDKAYFFSVLKQN